MPMCWGMMGDRSSKRFIDSQAPAKTILPAQAVAVHPSRPMQAHLRVARATDHLDAVLAFYRDGLGLPVVGQFQDHEGFDGIMLGAPGSQYHLEFTRERGASAGRAPNQESLLVFYLPDAEAFRAAIARLESL